MKEPLLLRIIKLIFGIIFCSIAILLPHRARNNYIKTLSFFIHLPYFVFGSTARFLLSKLEININDINWK